MRAYTSARATGGTPPARNGRPIHDGGIPTRDEGGSPPYDEVRGPAHDAARSAPASLPRPGRRLRTTHRAAGLAAAALALALPLSACSPDGASGAPSDVTAGSAAGSSPNPAPSVDRATYRHTLTGALEPLDRALRAVDKAHEGSALNAALDTASSRADRAADTLQMTAAPDDASSVNSQLVSALRALG
ncbi:hypothetical protein [Streptomyces kronopolitis]|uniref:hypothetical protein n=1 Tax=Streptomyces kronopolitis TaxID=1612435 RepID=UPI003D980ED6